MLIEGFGFPELPADNVFMKLWVFALLIIAGGLGYARPRPPLRETQAESRISLKSILAHRKLRFIVDTGPSGPLYTVLRKEGGIVLEKLPEEQLKEHYPDYWEYIRTALKKFPATWKGKKVP